MSAARPESLRARFARATLTAALASALLLGASAAAIAWVLWEAGVRSELEERASALAASLARDASEEDWNLAEDGQEALLQSGLGDYRLELWKDGALVAGNHAGPTLGPKGLAHDGPGWLVAVREPLPGLTLVAAAPRAFGSRALRVFGWSILLATPLCLLVALVTARVVARRALRPLQDLRQRVLAAQPGRRIGRAPGGDTVAEASDIEEAFDGLWTRLERALEREREFAANASHELKTPLTRLRLLSERARAAASGEAAAAIDEQRAEVDRLTRLVDSLLVLARDASAGLSGESVNLADLVRAGARQLFAAATEPELAAPDEAFVRGDEDLLRIASDNLLANALKFTRAGPARVSVEELPGEVRVTVTSPGARIDASERELLFERFYRGSHASPSTNGHGLGLALVRHIARLHGGDAACVSAPDQDACFQLTIPAWRLSHAPAPAAAEQPAGGPPRN